MLAQTSFLMCRYRTPHTGCARTRSTGASDGVLDPRRSRRLEAKVLVLWCEAEQRQLFLPSAAIRDCCQYAARSAKSLMPNEFVAVSGCDWKDTVRDLSEAAQ